MNLLRIGEHDLPRPSRRYPTDLGIDVRTAVAKTLQPGERFRFPTGFAYEWPRQLGVQVWPRSGLADKHGIDVLAGLVDPSYRGELQVILINHGQEPVELDVGDRIAQIVLTRIELAYQLPTMDEHFTEVESFETETVRGSQGFGSSGKN